MLNGSSTATKFIHFNFYKLLGNGGNKTLIGLATFRVSVIFPRTASSSSGFLTATQEAVGTSILSTRWRYLFALLSNLDRVLFFHNTSVDKFRLNCGKTVDSRLFAVGYLLHFGVGLNISLDEFTTLPGVLFTCSTFITLKLDIGFLLDVPKGVIFPNLKTLHLRSVVFFSDDSVESLISSCTSLEDMLLLSCEPLPVFATMMELKLGELWSSFKWAHWETRLETLLSSSPELEQLDFDQEFLSSLPDKGNILAHRINGGKPSTD
ncbi:hypothetical protein Gohar_016716 [Gossypium harknessii]|uniref:Uncharacterized protein n=1 Tax=Gossypium harknessii TaxID=34285 RepID=A0A7J9G3P2_9ROSI|nr:hypothetical protein [Gossypium harknessii]